ncbi:MAG: phytanoyl-CoA dioxygenase family protein [Bacteroidota bacterium]
MNLVTNPDSGSHRRLGGKYKISKKEIQQYHNLGYLVLNDVLTEAELETLDPWFDHFTAGKEMASMGKDFCDTSLPNNTMLEEFQMVNAMLPSKYRPELLNNVFHQIAQSIADQLYTAGKAAIDYEQFLAKKPSKPGAELAMHQDLNYWPKTKNSWTATFSLSLTDSDLMNGCLQVIPGTNKETHLRKQVPKSSNDSKAYDVLNRDESPTLVVEMKDTDEVAFLPVKRGGMTIHDERIVHGLGGNDSLEWHKTYVVAFRDVETIAEERAMGFTHSRNDEINWDKIIH